MVNSKKHTQDNEMGYYKLTNFKVVCIKELPKSLPSYIEPRYRSTYMPELITVGGVYTVIEEDNERYLDTSIPKQYLIQIGEGLSRVVTWFDQKYFIRQEDYRENKLKEIGI